MIHKDKESSIYNLVGVFRDLLSHLSQKRRRQFWMILFSMVILGVFETFTIGIIALYVS